MPEVLATGIDVSEFNGDIDFNALKGKIDFAIIRCGYGGNYVSQDDAEFEANVRKCEAAGIPYGVYLYSYARTLDMALGEAAHTLRLLRGKRPLYGVWYDVESNVLPTGDQLIDQCVAYCEKIREADFYVGIYSSLNWWETRLNSPRLNAYDKWVAQWNGTLDYTAGVGMWQYTDNGVLNGKRFDMNRAFRDFPKLTEEMEGTDMTRAEVAALAREEAQKVYDRNETKYRTMEDLPNWARTAAEEVYKELALSGTGETDGKTKIDASETYARTLVVVSRVLQKLEPPTEETLDKSAQTS